MPWLVHRKMWSHRRIESSGASFCGFSNKFVLRTGVERTDAHANNLEATTAGRSASTRRRAQPSDEQVGDRGGTAADAR